MSFALTNLYGFNAAAGGSPFAVSFISNGTAVAGLNISFTFDCGAADPLKIVQLALHQVGGVGGKLITAITVDGVNCLANVTQGQRHGTVWCALPSSSGVVTVNLTYDNAPNQFSWGAWKIINPSGMAPSDTQSTFNSTNASRSLNMTVPASGFAVVSGTETTAADVTTTNATEDYDAAFAANEQVGARTTTTGAVTVTMNAVSSMIGLAWGP